MILRDAFRCAFAIATVINIFLLSSITVVGAEEQITLQLAFWFGSEDLPYWQQAIDQFEKENPHIKIEIQTTPWNQYWTKLQTQAVGGTLPDIVGMVSMYSQEWIRQGSLLNLQPYIEREAFDLNDFWPVIIEAFSLDGNVYALPYDLSTTLLLGNVDLYHDAGVEFPQDKWTWDDFLSTALKLTRDTDGDGRVDQWGMGYLPRGWELEAYLQTAGASMVNEDRTKSTINSPAAVEAIQWWADLYLKYGVVPNPGEIQGDSGLFESRRVAMTAANPEWVMRRRIRMPDTSLDVARIPYKVKEANAVHGGGFAVAATTKYPEEAWEFVKFITSDHVLRTTVALSHRGIPSRRSLADVMVDSVNAVPHSRHFVDVLEHSHFLMFNNWSQVLQRLDQALDEIYLGLRPAQPALDQLARTIDPLLARN